MQAIIRTRATATVDTERRFARRIDRWVLDAARRGLTAFDDLVVSLPGVYPVAVLDALRRLAAHPGARRRGCWAETTVTAPHLPSHRAARPASPGL